MANKLKDIFSDETIDLGCNVHFRDNESYNSFLEALQIVQNEGRSVEVEGISSLDTKVRDGEYEYPFSEEKILTHVIVAPSTEDVPMVFNTEIGEKTILFKRYHTTNEIILETDKNDVIYFKIVFIKNSSNIKFTYKAQHCLAKTIKDIVHTYITALALVNKVFRYDNTQDLSDNDAMIFRMRETLIEFESLFRRLYLIEQELGLSFNPTKINDKENYEEQINELYLLLIEKKVIRLNAKLNATETTGMVLESETDELEVGNKLDITFQRELEYTILEQKISMYSANLLSNAIIKEIKKDENGIAKVLYGDTDIQPMYISFTGFKNLDEAKQEMNAIMEHKNEYVHALTFSEHMKQIKENIQ